MSQIVRAATATAVRASISMPVLSVHTARASISIPSSAMRKSTPICSISMLWQSGMRTAVRFAARIPAIRAAARTSPLFETVRFHEGDRFRREIDPARGPGGPQDPGLRGDVHHAGGSVFVDVGELFLHA